MPVRGIGASWLREGEGDDRQKKAHHGGNNAGTADTGHVTRTNAGGHNQRVLCHLCAYHMSQSVAAAAT